MDDIKACFYGHRSSIFSMDDIFFYLGLSGCQTCADVKHTFCNTNLTDIEKNVIARARCVSIFMFISGYMIVDSLRRTSQWS